jgi:dihydrofolate reductase
MRRIINSTNVTLDGVSERLPEWHFQYMDDEAVGVTTEDLHAAEALLMGRQTYDVFAASWPERGGDYADRINAMPKYVASGTLRNATWTNTTVIRDVAGEVADLKQQPGGDILMYGFGPVAANLLEHGLLDEIRLFVHPVLAGGTGQWADLLLDAGAVGHLELVAHRALRSGVMLLTYRPKTAS